MTYRKGGAVQLEGPGAAKRGKAMTEQIGAIAQVPGGLEMLMTIAAEELGGPKGGQSKQLRLYNMGGEVPGYQQGGLSQIMDQAQNVQAAGRGDDEMLLHVSPEEYEALTGMWGEPDINPDTGIPEYGFLSKLWKGIKKTVKKIVKSPLFQFIAPIALNIFAPGLGTAIGGWLGATGKVAATIGNTVLRAGIGAAGGGKEGAISGALSGLTSAGVGADIGKKLGLSGATARIAGDAIMGGVAGEGTGVGFKQGALGAGMQSLMGDPMQKMQDKLTGIGKDIFSPQGEFDVTPGSMTLDPSQQDPFGFGAETLPQTTTGGAVFDAPPPMADPSMWDKAKGWMGEHPWLTAGGAIAGAGALGLFDTPGEQGPPDFSAGLPPGFNDPLPNLSFDREQMPIQDYYSYGRGEDAGEAMFFGNNVIPEMGGPQAGVSPGGPGGPGGPGQQPIRLKGVWEKMRIPKLQEQGWTYDESSETMYPPGTFGPGGTGPMPSAHGGYVDAYDHGGYAEYKLGGLVRKYQSGGHVRGPGTGRSDEIPAVLSDGEYVIDSESVALLGDGSTDAGARRLDEMRSKLRKHKAKKLAKGGFSDEARDPMEYMAKGGRASKKKSTRATKITELMNKGLSRRNATDYVDGFITSKDGKMYNARTNKVVKMQEMQEGGYIPPDENPYKKGSARYKLWERKYGKKEDEKSKEDEKRDQLTTKETESLLAKARRWKSRTERELEKLGEKAEGGNVNKSGLLAIKRLASKLEFAITSGNKKRVKQIAAQLKSLDGGGGIEGFAYGGLVRNLTDSDITDIADDLGGFKNDRAFKRKFKARIREESARRG